MERGNPRSPPSPPPPPPLPHLKNGYKKKVRKREEMKEGS
jgi:hypothetical protein